MANDDTGSSRTPVRAPSPDDPTIGRLVADASRDISSLVSKEIELAKSELKVSVKAGGLGIGLLAGAAFIAVLGVIMLSFTIVYFIHWAGLGLHWSYLIVTGFWFLLVALHGLHRHARSSSRSARPRRPSSRAGRSRRRSGVRADAGPSPHTPRSTARCRWRCPRRPRRGPGRR